MGDLKNILRTIGILLIAACGCVGKDSEVPKSQTAKAKKTAPGADIFDNKYVLNISIEFSTNELKALQKDARHYVRAELREGTNVWRDVGVHLKGAAGSF